MKITTIENGSFTGRLGARSSDVPVDEVGVVLEREPAGRFAALDGVRGIAALAVLLHHYSAFNGTPWLLHGWIAVDVFICLSGFVIAHKYRASIESGLPFTRFARRRLNRLYPFYLVGLLLGGIAFQASEPVRNSFGGLDALKAFACGLFVLPFQNSATVPVGMGIAHGQMFPFNGPSWSMFFELAVNVLFFVLIAFRVRRLLWIAGFSAVLYVAAALSGAGLNSGMDTGDALVGLLRASSSFFLGVVLHGWHVRAPAWRLPMRYAWLGIGVMLLVFLAPASKLASLLGVLLLGPFVVWTCAAVRPGPRLSRAFELLGRISYPLYITHMPLMGGLTVLVFGPGPVHPQGAGVTVAAAVAAMAVAFGLAALDTRVRKLVRRRTEA